MPRITCKRILFTAAALVICFESQSSPSIEVRGLLEGGYINADYDKPWLNSWLEEGVGVLRFNRDDNLLLTQGVLEIAGDFSSDLSYHVTANAYPDGDKKFGLTEAFITYSPLSPGLKHQIQVGMFYPKMSLENVDLGWNSPFTYSFSAINSWLAEELRTIGAQWSVTRSGRKNNSPHTYTVSAAVFKANDVLGALLTWRGWAIHNRQTMYNEALPFADYFQFNQFDIDVPNSEVITEETDGRWGVYVGSHWRYLKSTDVRIYVYDNNADPLAIEDNNQYAWDTQFLSVSFQHKFNSDFRILGQWLTGKTQMGTPEKGVSGDYDAWYLLASYRWNAHRFSARYDKFSVQETDLHPTDPNDSHGSSLTLAWRYDINPSLNVGSEWTSTTSSNESRTLWQDWAAKHTQQQLMLLAQYRF